MDDNTQNGPPRDADQKKGRGPDYIAYTVQDRGPEKDAAWNRVGAAWGHKDGKGVDVALSSVPVDGRISLREARKAEFVQKRQDQAQEQGRSQTRDQSYERS